MFTAQAQAEYDSFMKDATASNKAKHDLEFKTSLKKDQTEFESSETTKDLEATQSELDKAPPPLMIGYSMESEIGYSHSQSHL